MKTKSRMVLFGCLVLAACADTPPSNASSPDEPDGPRSTQTGTTDPGGEQVGPTESPPEPSSPEAPPATAGLDPDGVEMKMPIDPAGSAWRLGSKDPNTDPELELKFASGPAVDRGGYWSATAEKRNSLTFRINVTVKASQGTQESNHDVLAARGYMVSPKDLKNLEMTGYFRVRGVTDPEEAITMKVRGGRHDGNKDPRAACIGILTEFTDANDRLWEKELFHPTTPRASVKRLTSHGPLEDHWVGVKAIVYNRPGDTSAVTEAWIDTDPFDDAGKPKNQWRKVYEWLDAPPGFGGRPVTWGGMTETWRIDAVKTIDFKLLSVHEIVPPVT